MKVPKVVFPILLALLLVLSIALENNAPLKTGNIAFRSMDTSDGDGFSIITFVNITPGTTIRFTDSEWNGNRFGADENDISWNTGKDTIPAGALIKFVNVDVAPEVSHGSVNGKLSLSKTSDALFAYLGPSRLPTTFLAAIANDHRAYGTLVNTGLVDGYSAICHPF